MVDKTMRNSADTEKCAVKVFPDRETVCRRLYEMADDKYRQFHSRLCPGTEGILGIRTPELRKYAREIINEYGQQVVDHLYTLMSCTAEDRSCPDDTASQGLYREFYYEEKMLTGMILGLWKAPDPQALEEKLEQFLPLIDNWAVCDVACGGLKYIGKHKEYFYPVLKKYLKSSETYTVRFGVVLLMDYYIEESWLPELFVLYEQIHHEDYYVKMAVAWAYSVLLVKYYEPTLAFLKNCRLDQQTFQKTIQKACESRRISEEQRSELRELKKNRMGKLRRKCEVEK